MKLYVNASGTVPSGYMRCTTVDAALYWLSTGKVTDIMYGALVFGGTTQEIAEYVHAEAKDNPGFTVPDWTVVQSRSPRVTGMIHRSMLNAVRARYARLTMPR